MTERLVSRGQVRPNRGKTTVPPGRTAMDFQFLDDQRFGWTDSKLPQAKMTQRIGFEQPQREIQVYGSDISSISAFSLVHDSNRYTR